jgi:4-aminobutyrate aminotransferase-like enzyme
MEGFRPEALSEEEVSQLLTPLKQQILFEGVPGSAILRDTAGEEYIDCTAQAWTLNAGYCNPDVLYTVAEQMKRLTHVR